MIESVRHQEWTDHKAGKTISAGRLQEETADKRIRHSRQRDRIDLRAGNRI